MQLRVLILPSILMLIASGCADLATPKSNGKKLRKAFQFPAMRMTADAVRLEIGVAQLASDQAEQFEQLWRSMDQQKLSLEQRQQLDRNGIRCAVMSTRPPAVFHELFEPYLPDPETLDPVAKQMALAGRLQPVPRLLLHQKISNREGDSFPVKTSAELPETDWVLRDANQQTPGSAQLAAGAFHIATFPQPDGSVRLSVQPTIHHGEDQARIAVAHGSFIRDFGQQEIPLESLKFHLQLKVGETLLVASSPAADSIGKLLFCDGTDDQAQRVLLVRLVQTQMDDLFDRTVSIEKLNTTPNH